MLKIKCNYLIVILLCFVMHSVWTKPTVKRTAEPKSFNTTQLIKSVKELTVGGCHSEMVMKWI